MLTLEHDRKIDNDKQKSLNMTEFILNIDEYDQKFLEIIIG